MYILTRYNEVANTNEHVVNGKSNLGLEDNDWVEFYCNVDCVRRCY